MRQTQTLRRPASGRASRRLLILGTPLAYAVVTVIHPREFPSGGNSMYADLHGQAGTWLTIHTVQILLVMLLGATMWALVDGLDGTAAKVARLAVLPFVAFYAAFDAIVGFATGLLIHQANGVSGAKQAAAAQQIQQYFDNVIKPGLPTLYVIATGIAAWAVGMFAVAVARRQAGASRTAVALLAVATMAFGFDHGFPTGTIGMAALFLAALLLERRATPQVERAEIRPASIAG